MYTNRTGFLESPGSQECGLHKLLAARSHSIYYLLATYTLLHFLAFLDWLRGFRGFPPKVGEAEGAFNAPAPAAHPRSLCQTTAPLLAQNMSSYRKYQLPETCSQYKTSTTQFLKWLARTAKSQNVELIHNEDPNAHTPAKFEMSIHRMRLIVRRLVSRPGFRADSIGIGYLGMYLTFGGL